MSTGGVSSSVSSLDVQVSVEMSDYQIKDGDYVSRVVLQLTVQTFIKLEQVIAVHVKSEDLCFMDLLESLNVEWLLLKVIVLLSHLNEGHQEVFELRLHFS